MHRRTAGFTIVELLIVIVVIGILAAITIVAYNGVQSRARDTLRVEGIAKIRNALELYKIDNGAYPSAINSNTASTGNVYPGGGWEVAQVTPSTWLDRLAAYIPGKIPTDPVNDSVHYYYYYFYTNNPGICGATTPNCYKLGISRLDAMDGLTVPGVDTAGSDPWRNSSATRAVWTERY
jgi:general secretion pathway protein G